MNLISHLDSYLQTIQNYPLSDSEKIKEQETVLRFKNFMKTASKPFSRDNLEGHFCGSAWVLDKEKKRVVLTHHVKLQKWIQLGGHADGDVDLFHVALKEALEESGLKNLTPLLGRNSVFNFAIHEIPEYKGVPAHLHYDATYVFVAEDEELLCSDESFEIRWFTFAEAMKVADEQTGYQLKNLEFFLKKLL